VERFLERNHDVRLDVAAAFRGASTLPKWATAKTGLASTAKKLFEEITETSAAEFEFDAAVVAGRVATESAARLLRAPTRWRLKSPRPVPISAQLVVFLPLLRIAQDFVGFVELFEFLFRRCLVLVDVGMVLARQFSEGLLNLVVTRRLRNAQRLVIISKFNSHRLEEDSVWRRANQGAAISKQPFVLVGGL
jgi:hypothetical protein